MTHSEQSAAAELQKQEPDAVVIKMTATGNPDFIVIPKTAISAVRFVEVKLKDDTVPEHQQEVHSKLRSQGFRVDVMRRITQNSCGIFLSVSQRPFLLTQASFPLLADSSRFWASDFSPTLASEMEHDFCAVLEQLFSGAVTGTREQ